MSSKKKANLISTLTAAFLAVTASVSSGCGHDPAKVTEATAKAKLIVALDTSDSPAVPALVNDVAKAVPFLPEGTFLSVLAFDSKVKPLMSEPAPASGDAFITGITFRLEKRQAKDAGTRFDLVLPKVAAQAHLGSCNVVVLIESDMIPDGMSRAGLRAMRAAAADLARNPRVTRVVIVGASPKAGDVIEKYFSPLIPAKLVQYNLRSSDPEAVAGGFR